MSSWIGAATLPSQTVRIVDIPAAGLFRLGNGDVVALAHVQLPADTVYRRLQRHIASYAKNHFLRQQARVQYSGNKAPNGTPLVHLTIWYPLERLNVNEQFLLKGFGRFTEQGDSLNRERYRKAETYAQGHQQGLWSPNHYGNPFFKPYLVSAHFGYGRGTEGDHTLTFQAVRLRWEPLKAVSGLETDVSLLRVSEQGELCCECDYVEPHQPRIRTEVSTLISAYVQYNQNWKYGGFSAGLSWLYLGDLYCSEAPAMVVLPRLSGRVGWLNKLYVNVTAFNLSAFSLLTTELTYVFSERGEQISVSGSWYNGQIIMGSRIRVQAWKHWTVTASGTWYRNNGKNFNFQENSIFGILGVGYIFK